MIAANNGSFPWRGLPTGPGLLEALAHPAGPETDRLRLLQDRATRESIDEQVAAGLDLVTDGLIRRADPVEPVARLLRGMRVGENRVRYPGRADPVGQPVAESEIGWNGPILVEDYLFASRGASRPVKVVLTGPYTIAHLADDRAYADASSLAMALAIALNQELRALQGAGATMIQIDEPALIERRTDFPIFTRIWEVLGRGISATLILHLEGGGLEGLYPGLTRLKRLGGLSIDAVAGRASLDLFRDQPLPSPIHLGLGLVDGRNETIETPEALSEQVRAAIGLPPPDRLILGTASDLGGLPHDAALGKLKALARAARLLEQG